MKWMEIVVTINCRDLQNISSTMLSVRRHTSYNWNDIEKKQTTIKYHLVIASDVLCQITNHFILIQIAL